MKNILVTILFLIIILNLNAQIFEVDKQQFLTFTSACLALDLSNNYLDDQLIKKPSIADLAELDENDVPFFDRVALREHSQKLKDWSDYTAVAAIGIAAYTAYDRDYWLDNLMVFSEIMIAQSAAAKWCKTLSSRYRPFVYNDDITLEKKQENNSQHSFYSMHSSTTFAASTFAYYYYSQNFGANFSSAILFYTPAALTAYLRVASANHFPSDVVVGAIMGSGISYLICSWHRSNTVVINLGYNQAGFGIRF